MAWLFSDWFVVSDSFSSRRLFSKRLFLREDPFFVQGGKIPRFSDLNPERASQEATTVLLVVERSIDWRDRSERKKSLVHEANESPMSLAQRKSFLSELGLPE